MSTKRAKSRLAGELGRFMQQYARKAQASDPNDRQYDRKLEKKMKRLSPAELSDLISGDEGGTTHGGSRKRMSSATQSAVRRCYADHRQPHSPPRGEEVKMKRLRREEPLPEKMQGRWIAVDDPLSELVVDGGEITCFGMVVNYEHKIIIEKGGALTVSLGIDDDRSLDDFQRANITGLVTTPDGQFHVYNARFGLRFVRPAS